MITKEAHVRLIINADKKSLAKKIADKIILNISVDKKSLSKLLRYEDEAHYDISFTSKLTASTYKQLEHQSFKLCTNIVKGPWLFQNLAEKYDKYNFTFLAIFNYEAFIKNDPFYNNKLKWALVEIIN
ncbi:MAG TPA: hypothetical protein PKA80_10545 [Ignavibacteriaceae bacterium]|nr:hypothetical protein [Ignavibacteriaceae bacterium]